MKLSIEVKDKADVEKLRSALLTLSADEPSFRVSFDPESGHFILQGMDERHLDLKLDLLRHTFSLDLIVGIPGVAYLETMARCVEQNTTYEVTVGGEVQFARVRIVFEPDSGDGDDVFASKINAEAIPIEYVSGIEKGVRDVFRAGILAGFPVVGVKATLIEVARRDGASSGLAFETAARTACRQALKKGGPLLLEPIMRVEVATPHTFIGSVVGDLRSRRGVVQNQDATGKSAIITANVPLSNLFGYANQLRSFSEGHATFTMAFERYEPTPPGHGGRPPPAVAAALRA